MYNSAKVVAQYLIDQGQGVDSQTASLGDWPISWTGEASNPDKAVTVMNTSGQLAGKLATGDHQEFVGFSLKVKAKTEREAAAKLSDLIDLLDEETYRATVTIGDYTFLLHSANRVGTINYLGKSAARRSVVTVNYLMSISMVENEPEPTPTGGIPIGLLLALTH